MTKSVKELLDNFTYKPGWKFIAMKHRCEGDWIRIEVTLEDSYNPGNTTDLGINCPVPPYKEDYQFYDWLLYRLMRVETHECREWFKVDGEIWADPHIDIEDQLVSA